MCDECIAAEYCLAREFWEEMPDSLHDCPSGRTPCPDLEINRMFR